MADAKFIAMMRSLIVENPTDVDRDDDKVCLQLPIAAMLAHLAQYTTANTT